MNGINSTTIVGTVTQQPETRYAASGTAVTNISVVTNYKPKNSEEVPEYHRCVAFGRTAEVAGEYLKVGSRVGIMGRLQTRKYEKNGVTRYSTEIVVNDLQLLDSKRDSQQAPASKPAPAANTVAGGESDFDSIPFAKVDGRYV